MNRSGSLRSNSSGTGSQWSTATGDSLCNEMSALMHDYETVSRIADLAASLKTPYSELSPDVLKTLLQTIQRNIQVASPVVERDDSEVERLSRAASYRCRRRTTRWRGSTRAASS